MNIPQAGAIVARPPHRTAGMAIANATAGGMLVDLAEWCRTHEQPRPEIPG